MFFVSLLSSFVLTRYVRDFANSRGWVFAPTQERHLHSTALPRLGGVAIFLSFFCCMAIAAVWTLYQPRFHAAFSLKTLGTILVPATLVFLLGVYDDLRDVGPYFKFSVQGIAATMLFMGGLRIVNIPVIFGDHQLPWLVGWPLTVLWVLAITNAFNLIDGLDGLAAGSALFSTLVAFVVALLNGQSLLTVMTIALAGATLGFLRYNFNPATIFLGDSGSLFIGFVLSALALAGAQKAPTIVAVAIPVVSFGLPILETALSIVRRLISGRPVFTADREHIHHKLLQHGMTHRQVVILLYGVSAIFAMLSLFLLWPTGSSLGLVLAVLGIGIWIGVQHLGYLEFGELARVAHRTLDQPQIFVNNLAIRRATEELKVARDYEQIRRILLAADPLEVGEDCEGEGLDGIPSRERDPPAGGDEPVRYPVVQDLPVRPRAGLPVPDHPEEREACEVTVLSHVLGDEVRGTGRGDLAPSRRFGPCRVHVELAVEPGRVVIDDHDMGREVLPGGPEVAEEHASIAPEIRREDPVA
jgi:UDP-GlcNAc:undecaprenyl-phosphate GlcNAc-1-phosphate transferase